MRVVYVSSLAAGGPLSHLLDLAPAVAEQGVDVLVLCASDELRAAFAARGVEAHARPLRHKGDIAGARGLWADLRGSDVVHTHDRRAGLLARPLARMRGARAVHTLHGVPEELVLEVGRLPGRDPAVPVRQVAYARHVTLRADALLARLGTVVVPSRAFAEYLGAHGFPRRRLRVIPYGITPATAQRTQAATGPLLVGTAANLEYHKGIDLLVEAAARVRTPLRLDVYGTGSQREALQARARSLGIDVTFHGQVTDLRDRLEALDVFVLPTRGDNFPVTLLEAMSAGVAVVATRVGGVPELVGEAGIVVEPESVESLATALDDLAADPERRAELGQAGAARVRARFDARALAGEMVRLYTEIAG